MVRRWYHKSGYHCFLCSDLCWLYMLHRYIFDKIQYDKHADDIRAFLNLVRSMRSTTFNAFTFSVIFCHITLERSWVIAFVHIFVECTLPRQSPIANRVHKRQRKRIDRHAIIFLTTYFRTTPMADVDNLRKTKNKLGLDYNYGERCLSPRRGWYWQWFIAYDCSGGFYNYVITCPHCVSFTVALVICKLKRILKGFTSLGTASVFRRCE